jgi:hypothetical protein
LPRDLRVGLCAAGPDLLLSRRTPGAEHRHLDGDRAGADRGVGSQASARRRHRRGAAARCTPSSRSVTCSIAAPRTRM